MSAKKERLTSKLNTTIHIQTQSLLNSSTKKKRTNVKAELPARPAKLLLHKQSGSSHGAHIISKVTAV